MSFAATLHSVSLFMASVFGVYVFWIASFFGNDFYSFYMCFTKNKNWRLKVMIFSMMVEAASFPALTLFYIYGYYTTTTIVIGIELSFDSYVHWMFCYIYLKL